VKHAIARGSGGMPPRKILKISILRLILEVFVSKLQDDLYFKIYCKLRLKHKVTERDEWLDATYLASNSCVILPDTYTCISLPWCDGLTCPQRQDSMDLPGNLCKCQHMQVAKNRENDCLCFQLCFAELKDYKGRSKRLFELILAF